MLTTTRSWTAEWNGKTIEVINHACLFQTKSRTEIKLDGRPLNVKKHENTAISDVRARMCDPNKRKRGGLMSAVRSGIDKARDGAAMTARFMHEKKRHTVLAKIKPNGMFGFACLILVDKIVIGGDINAFNC
ncbi:MAG: hypothetical protein U9N14_03735 [Pseudomonadota bacterium]|nr:hypothetical protein [Pseudomonadota bacterium]